MIRECDQVQSLSRYLRLLRFSAITMRRVRADGRMESIGVAGKSIMEQGAPVGLAICIEASAKKPAFVQADHLAHRPVKEPPLCEHPSVLVHVLANREDLGMLILAPDPWGRDSAGRFVSVRLAPFRCLPAVRSERARAVKWQTPSSVGQAFRCIDRQQRAG